MAIRQRLGRSMYIFFRDSPVRSPQHALKIPVGRQINIAIEFNSNSPLAAAGSSGQMKQFATKPTGGPEARSITTPVTSLDLTGFEVGLGLCLCLVAGP